jgi:malate/lactate dehydrogenase
MSDVDTSTEAVERLAASLIYTAAIWKSRADTTHPIYRDASVAAATLRALAKERDELAKALNERIRRWGDAIVERDAARAEAARLREALAELEAACDEMAYGRTHQQYLAMIADGQQDALLRLYFARAGARAALPQKEPGHD